MPGNYSIEMGFTLDRTDGYRRLIEFKNLMSDNGLYNLDTALNFFDETTGPSGVFEAGVPVTVEVQIVAILAGVTVP